MGNFLSTCLNWDIQKIRYYKWEIHFGGLSKIKYGSEDTDLRGIVQTVKGGRGQSGSAEGQRAIQKLLVIVTGRRALFLSQNEEQAKDGG